MGDGNPLLRLKTSGGALRVLKPVAMVGWSGAGSFDDLEGTVVRKLGIGKSGADRIDDALLVDSDDPVAVARQLAFLPGVAWISVGYRFAGTQNYLKNLELLARRYISKKGRTFRLSAQIVSSKQTAGDAVLAGNSHLLSAIPGAKVNERRPHVKFRVCMEGGKGACGVEIRVGPGGIPTRQQWVACLVSGGERSSSLAWMAALSGFSLRLVHSRTDEGALRQVARLYSELSFRIDPSCLELLVLDGGGTSLGRIGGWLHDSGTVVFAGLRPESPEALVEFARRFPNLVLPLILVQDETVDSMYRSLGLGRAAGGTKNGALTASALKRRSRYSERRIGGVQADSNAVIDAMKLQG